MAAAPVAVAVMALGAVPEQQGKEIAEVGVIPGPAWEPALAAVAAKAGLEETAAHIIRLFLLTQAQADWGKRLQLRLPVFSMLAVVAAAATVVEPKVLAGQVLAETEAVVITLYLPLAWLTEAEEEEVTAPRHLRAALAALAAPALWLSVIPMRLQRRLLLDRRFIRFLVDTVFIVLLALAQFVGDAWLILLNLTKTTSCFRSSLLITKN
jgi:hypothetical protein